MLSVVAVVALGSAATAAAPRPALVYASARLVHEEGGPRIDQVTDLFVVAPDGGRVHRLTRTGELGGRPELVARRQPDCVQPRRSGMSCGLL